jgi:hypothetical protein
MELRRALRQQRMARGGFHANPAREFKIFDFSNNVFPSEASYDEGRLVFAAVQSTDLYRKDAAHRWRLWSRHIPADDGHRGRAKSDRPTSRAA